MSLPTGVRCRRPMTITEAARSSAAATIAVAGSPAALAAVLVPGEAYLVT